MKPNLDHHVGKIAETAEDSSPGWVITLEGNTEISCTTGAKPLVENLTLKAVTDSEDHRTMHFGNQGADSTEDVLVDVVRGTYEIDGVDPHAPDEDAVIPDDPSPDRIQDQPEGGWPDEDEE